MNLQSKSLKEEAFSIQELHPTHPRYLLSSLTPIYSSEGPSPSHKAEEKFV